MNQIARESMERERPIWLSRLVAEIEKCQDGGKGTAYRQISISAGLGPNYVSQLLGENWKTPSFDNVVRLCEALNISITYLVTGAEMTRFDEDLLRQLELLDDHTKKYLLGLLASLQRDGAPTQ
jgi:transcriptional regulator with XRE-family HTH domain